ncbi:hypothetical protein XELAEV_18014749mg [Xenopus laevis]|uniref:Uncharacterized protein n=1 Tax=Xenopus laevis TaxID=8355 RepID=A0A974DGP5_XENLA|nr:hypothetical protein XELAEV_18014749mg [Xenopus laevis]
MTGCRGALWITSGRHRGQVKQKVNFSSQHRCPPAPTMLAYRGSSSKNTEEQETEIGAWRCVDDVTSATTRKEV